MLFDIGMDGCPLEGERVELDSSLPALRPCRYCDSKLGVKTGPKGPHHDGVRCAECLRHLGWLPPPVEDFEVIE